MMHFIPFALCGYGLIVVSVAVENLPHISYLYIITDKAVYNVPSVMSIGPQFWAFVLQKEQTGLRNKLQILKKKR
jgi:hypothetical protein